MMRTAATLDLPPPYCPIESVIHPKVDLIEQHSIDWLDKFALTADSKARARLIGTNAAHFFARLAPVAPVARIQPAAHWCYWGFAFDDIHCDGRSRSSTRRLVDFASRLLCALESPLPLSNFNDPFTAALSDISNAFHSFSTDTQLRRWANAHRGWLLGAAWEASNNELRVIPTLADYLPMRLQSCAGEPTIAMIEMVTGYEVPASELDRPLVVALSETARMTAALDNDLVSYRKEARCGQSSQNIISVIASHDSCSVEEALSRAVEIRDRIMVLFLRLCDKLPDSCSYELHEYVSGLCHTIRGNLEWSLQVPRYHAFDGTPKDTGGSVPKRALEWAERPSSSDLQPVPAPRLAWWWDQL